MTSTHTDNAVDGITSPTLAGIQHVGLTVRDVDASVEWYVRVLGLERQFDELHHHSDQGGYAVVLGTSDMSLNVGLDHHPRTTARPSIRHERASIIFASRSATPPHWEHGRGISTDRESRTPESTPWRARRSRC